MSYEEAMDWRTYAAKRGTLNIGRRMEFLFARLSHQTHQAHFENKREFDEFLRYEDEEAADIDDVAKLMGVARVEKR